MKLFKYMFFFACVFLSFCSAASWEGKYFCELQLGTTVPQEAIVIEYDLTYLDEKCRLEVNGFQIADSIVCEAQIKNDELHVNFMSYSNGSTTNIYGEKIYNPGETLFILKGNSQKPLTLWKSLWPGEPIKKRDTCFTKE